MNLATAIKLYATAAGTGSEGSSLVSPNIGNDLRVKDIARRRLSKSNPDVDSEGEDGSKQERIGKKKKDKLSI
jgi:hypothetical protein